MDNETVAQETENLEEKETLKNDLKQTNEDVELEDDKLDEDVVKEEVKDEYEQELVKLQEKLDKQDEIISHKNRAITTLKKKSKGDDNVFGEISELKKKAQKEIEEIKQTMLSETIDSQINNLASSPSEAKLIKFHLENSVKLKGYDKESIRDAISTAKLKANEKKIMSNMEEMKVALQANATTNTSRDGSSVNTKEPKKSNLSVDEKKFLETYGVKPN